MRPDEGERIDAAQSMILWAYAFIATGMVSIGIGASAGIDPRGPIMVWLGICAFGAIVSVFAALFRYFA